MIHLVTLVAVSCLFLLVLVYGVEVDTEYKALLEFDRKISTLTLFLRQSTDEEAVPLSSLLDLTILHHMRDERWKQGGSWESIAYADLALDQLLADPSEDSTGQLVYALLLHKARLLTTVGEFAAAMGTMDRMLEHLATAPAPTGTSTSTLEAIAYFTKGRALLSAGRVAEAERLFAKAFVLDACLHQAYYQYATTLLVEKNTAKMTAIVPLLQNLIANVHESLVLEDICVFVTDHELFFQLYRQSEIHTSSAFLTTQNSTHWHIIQATLHWSLFLLYDAQKQHRQAWAELMAARQHEAYRQHLSDSSVSATQQILSFFNKGFWPLQRADLVGSSSKVPVFIVGFFRSGSTLLETLLSVDPSILAMGEHSPFTYAMHPLQADLLAAASVDVEGDGHMLHTLRQPLQQHAQRILTDMQNRFTQHEAYTKITGHVFANLSQVYDASKAAHIVDKMLLNFRNIALIHLVFPEALILHTTRDPMDTLMSCLKNRFGDLSACSLGLEDMVVEYVCYLEIMHHFHTVLPRLPFEIYTEQGPRIIQRTALIDVRYEEMVANPARVMTRIFSLLGRPMPSAEQMQAFYTTDRAVHTASYLQVKQPIYAKSVGQWRKYAEGLKETVVAELEKHLPRLRAKGALPYMDDAQAPMNWDLREDFDYNAHLKALR